MSQSGRGNSWVGWLIFFLVIFGGRLLTPLASWLSQLTGLQITAPMLVVATIALTVVGSLAGSVARQIGKARSSGETRLPTPMSTTPPVETTYSRPSSTARPSSPPTSVRLPPTSSGLPPPRLPSGEQRLPGPPKFEPIIDPRILTFGILGLIILGGIFLVVLALSGALP